MTKIKMNGFMLGFAALYAMMSISKGSASDQQRRISELNHQNHMQMQVIQKQREIDEINRQQRQRELERQRVEQQRKNEESARLWREEQEKKHLADIERLKKK